MREAMLKPSRNTLVSNRMVKTLFIAQVPFGPSDGEKWQKCCDWAKIPNLREIIGLDGMLCHPGGV